MDFSPDRGLMKQSERRMNIVELKQQCLKPAVVEVSTLTSRRSDFLHCHRQRSQLVDSCVPI